MLNLFNQCPACGGPLVITEIKCTSCHLTMQGEFKPGLFSTLSDDQLTFVRAFLRVRGNLSEMEKVLENSYRAMNIAFMVEWSRFAEEAGVNIYEVVNAIRMRPTHKNLMLPGLGVGGYCLTKDPLLASWARMNLFGSEEPLEQSETGVHINDQMPIFAFQFLQSQYNGSLKEKKVLLLGVSYLNDVGDTRFTPVQGIYEQLVAAGCDVTLHDPHVMYWEEKRMRVNNDLDELLKQSYDLIIVTTGHKDYRNNASLINKLVSQQPAFVYDTIGILTDDEINALQSKHVVKVIGRGELKKIKR